MTLATRRSFLAGLSALVAAPAVIRVADLMPISARALVAPEYPVGSIIPVIGQRVPPGWILCDGRPLCKVGYSKLYAVMGDKYGVNEAQFRVPEIAQSAGRHAIYAAAEDRQASIQHKIIFAIKATDLRDIEA